MAKGLFSLFCFLFSLSAFSQSDTTNIPLARQTWHDKIKKEQILVDKLDGKQDGMLRAGTNEAVNQALSDALYRKPNQWRQWIESDNTTMPTANDKVGKLRNISELLKNFREAYRRKEIGLSELPALVEHANSVIRAKASGMSMLPFLESQPWSVAAVSAKTFGEEKKDAAEAASIVYLKYAQLHPEKILLTIAPFADQSYADSLIVVAGKHDPMQFYKFASAEYSVTGRLIHRNTDPAIRQIAELSKTPNALLYFPFLDDLLSGKQTIAEIKTLVGDGEKGYDSVGYYKLLVKTAISYHTRMSVMKDTPVAYFGTNGLRFTLQKKALEHFIKHINDLHDLTNISVRMKSIQPLAPVELYHMIIAGENDIYTSSYKHSFNRLLDLMGPAPRGDSLLLAVNFDHFRKFIKMAANYNKLDTFLKTMPTARATQLMKAFTANLDNADLEDAVDVADSYSSITDITLQQSMLADVTAHEATAIAANNKKGKLIYGLLRMIFLSADEKNNIDLSALTGIPSLYEVSNPYLREGEKPVVEQVFFYGDKDGKIFFPPFRASLVAGGWKVTDKKEWIEAVSPKGNAMVFANKPLETNDNLDDTAQAHLARYLEDKELRPSVIVHRGHSYWLNRTMQRMPGDAKIVVLGSCGGYQNLNEILVRNPDAHIISTKEIGAGDINRPILNYMHAVFANAQTLEWRKMWQSLGKQFANEPNRALRESWEDYVPPYKNLGAIFLKAYTRAENVPAD